MHAESRASRLAELPKVKCFGSKAALCAEATFMAPDVGALPTVNLEVAPRQAQTVAWERKIVVQLSASELPLACAVLAGYLPNLHVKRPGKGIELERQPNRLFVRASAGPGNLYLLPVTIGDTFRLSALLLGQLMKQAGMTDASLALAALRGAAALYAPQDVTG